jgi:hypothetical protein
VYITLALCHPADPVPLVCYLILAALATAESQDRDDDGNEVR